MVVCSIVSSTEGVTESQFEGLTLDGCQLFMCVLCTYNTTFGGLDWWFELFFYNFLSAHTVGYKWYIEHLCRSCAVCMVLSILHNALWSIVQVGSLVLGRSSWLDDRSILFPGMYFRRIFIFLFCVRCLFSFASFIPFPEKKSMYCSVWNRTTILLEL